MDTKMIKTFVSAWSFPVSLEEKRLFKQEDKYGLWEKAMAPHSSTLAWKIQWMEELGAAVHGVAKSRTWLSDFTFTFHFHALEKETATHSSVLVWRIPGTGEPGRLQTMGSHRVGHDWSDLVVVVVSILESNFTALKILCAWPIHLSLPSNPNKHK